MTPPVPTGTPVAQAVRRCFIADVHLNGSDTAYALKFRELLKHLTEENQRQPTELFVLGDLFEFWYEYRAPLFSIYRRDLEALETAWHAGLPIYLLFGNRDFLAGKYVRQRFGATVLGDGEQITLSDSRPAWLEHGDLLCTADRSYLRFRALVRSWPVRLALWMTPWSITRGMVERVKRRSAAHKSRKPAEAFDIDLAAARRRLEAKKCRLLLCGHTHRPKSEDLGAGYRLIVLPAWCEEQAGYVDDGGTLRSFKL